MCDAFEITAEDFQKDMTTNVLGPTLITQAFLPLLERPSTSEDNKLPVVVNISSGTGSIGLKHLGPVAALYAVTKAALNMLVSDQFQVDSY